MSHLSALNALNTLDDLGRQHDLNPVQVGLEMIGYAALLIGAELNHHHNALDLLSQLTLLVNRQFARGLAVGAHPQSHATDCPEQHND